MRPLLSYAIINVLGINRSGVSDGGAFYFRRSFKA